MRIAAISDIHGNLTAFEAVLQAIEKQPVDAVVCLGDLAFKGPRPGECVARVRSLGIPCIHGNTDLYLLQVVGLEPTRPLPGIDLIPPDALPYFRWHVERMSREDLQYLAALPFEHRLAADGLTLQFVHATPQDVIAAIRPCGSHEEIQARLAGTVADWVIMGHIHEPFCFRHGGKTLINTGAIGFSLDRDWRASYAVLDTANRSVHLHRVAYDIDAAVAAARRAGFCFDPDWYGGALRQGFWENIPYVQRQAIDHFPPG
jgi:predicted phosphodiesterase